MAEFLRKTGEENEAQKLENAARELEKQLENNRQYRLSYKSDSNRLHNSLFPNQTEILDHFMCW
ncbi:MAG: hypothetical protein C4527_12040 [Candidatus Omnitrophota bacterium]|nr:MAG: hypothetical protein C4527_12040 [Candidatus Omnitrophota bacterium]